MDPHSNDVIIPNFTTGADQPVANQPTLQPTYIEVILSSTAELTSKSLNAA